MATVIGTRCNDGVVIVGDRRDVRDGRVSTDDCQRVFDLDDAAVGVVGPASGVQTLIRSVRDEIRTYLHDREGPIAQPAFERILADAAKEADATCLGSARNEEGKSILFRVDEGGGTTRDDRLAIGTGGDIAIGSLEQMKRDDAVEAAESQLLEILAIVEARDTATGLTTDSVILRDR